MNDNTKEPDFDLILRQILPAHLPGAREKLCLYVKTGQVEFLNQISEAEWRELCIKKFGDQRFQHYQGLFGLDATSGDHRRQYFEMARFHEFIREVEDRVDAYEVKTASYSDKLSRDRHLIETATTFILISPALAILLPMAPQGALNPMLALNPSSPLRTVSAPFMIWVNSGIRVTNYFPHLICANRLRKEIVAIAGKYQKMKMAPQSGAPCYILPRDQWINTLTSQVQYHPID